jgi:hypothetical protein
MDAGLELTVLRMFGENSLSPPSNVRQTDKRRRERVDSPDRK